MATEACYECGKSFSQDEMVQYSGSWVCAGCKPVFLQKLKEGVPVKGTLNYAGFWIRFGAKFVDVIVLQVVGFIAGFVIVPSAPGEFNVVALLVNFLIGLAYNVYFLGAYGATPGKMACGLKVVTAEGGPVSYGRAVGRYFAEIVSGLILGIGYIMAAFDEEKRALHDRMCDTRVIKK